MILDAPNVARRGEHEHERAQPGVVAMRIHHWHGLPAVVRVQTRSDVIVAIPDRLPGHHVLDLASLVLTAGEYEELRNAIESAPDAGPEPLPAAVKPSR